MKTTTLAQNGVSTEMVDLIPWPARRCAMGEVTLLLLDGKHRVAESVFGWNRSAVEVGINEFQTGISCVNDLSTRLKPKTEEKSPKLLAAIHAIIDSIDFLLSRCLLFRGKIRLDLAIRSVRGVSWQRREVAAFDE